MTPVAACGCCVPASTPPPDTPAVAPAAPAAPPTTATTFEPAPTTAASAPQVVPPPAPTVAPISTTGIPSSAPTSPAAPTTAAPATPAATTPAAATSDVTLVKPAAGDAQLMTAVEGQMRQSPTAAIVLGKLQAAHAQVQFISQAELDTKSRGAQALYSSQDNVLYIPREAAQKDPRIVAVMVAHEGTHWSHDALIDRARATSVAGLQTAHDPQAYGTEKLVENSLATEVEAHMVEARVGTELGLKTPAGHPALNADGSYASFAQTWQHLEADTGYNPGKVVTPPVWYRQILPDDGSQQGTPLAAT